MGFMAFVRKTGFQDYYGREDFDADSRFNGDEDFDGMWAIWDEPFLQYYCTKMSEMKQPFMTAVFTASSHHPYVVPEKYKTVYPEEGIIIHKCIRYTDMALGKFFQAASR
jgi:phosphoglycerol transferase MdoB-like AlkP superfamily enzyme